MTAKYATFASLASAWQSDIEGGKPPIRYLAPPPFDALDIRPGRLLLFGGCPGAGKSAALLQIVVDLLRGNETVRVMFANVEMAPALLIERIIARQSGVPFTAIHNRTLSPAQLDCVKAAVASLGPIADRLAFMEEPYTLEHLAASGTEFDANMLIVDYIQRFGVGGGSESQRERLENAADALRRFCLRGAAVLCAAAVSRQKSASGSTYKGLNLASFRGSSELEYNGDSAYLLIPDDADGVVFQCEKNRYGAVSDIRTRFDRAIQAFAAATEPAAGLSAFDATKPAPESRGKKKGA